VRQLIRQSSCIIRYAASTSPKKINSRRLAYGLRMEDAAAVRRTLYWPKPIYKSGLRDGMGTVGL